MTASWSPLEDVFVEDDGASVQVTFVLEPEAFEKLEAVEFFTLGVLVPAEDNVVAKRFGAKFVGDCSTVFVWEAGSGTQSTYPTETLMGSPTSLTVQFPDAALKLRAGARMTGYVNVEGDDVQLDAAVTLLQ